MSLRVLCSLYLFKFYESPFLLRPEYCVSIPYGTLLLDKTIVPPLPLLPALTTFIVLVFKCHVHSRLFEGRLLNSCEKDENTATFVWWKFRLQWAISRVDETFYSKICQSAGQNGILSHISGIEAAGKSVNDICRLQSADCRPQTADRRLQTADC